MKIYLVAVMVVFIQFIGGNSGIANEQTKVKKRFVSSLNVSQVQYEDWAAGGENALSYVVTLDGRVERNNSHCNWDISGKFVFGQTKQQGTEIRNSVDRIESDVAMTYKLSNGINPFVGMGLDTQFTTGYDYRQKPKLAKSDFADPLYLNQSVGASYKYGSKFSTRLGFAFKETITQNHRIYSDNPKTPDIKEWKKVKTGIQSQTRLSCKIGQNLSFESKLRCFSTFEHIDVVDVKWDHSWTAKVAKYVSVNLNILVIYDKDVTLQTQIKESLAIGLTYTFL